MLKNEAIIKITQASDTWNFYQAKKTKGHLMAIAAELTNDTNKAENFNHRATNYNQQASQLQIQAQGLDQEAQATNQLADYLLEPHDRFAQAMTLLQIAISLASITALTRKRWLLSISLISAFIGVIFAILAWLS